MKKLLIAFVLSTLLYGAPDCQKASDTQEFVKRFYSVILGRTADNAGMDDWTNQLLKRSKTGADVAQGFIFSVEYNIDSQSNTQYLNDLYSAFFNRAADTAGFNDWIGQLGAGTSRDDVLHGFLYSQEFINLSNSYGIQAYEGAAFESEEITNFVKRFYTVILGRTADSGGLADWTNRLSTGVATGSDIAKGFIFSLEYNLESKSNTQYLNDLYSAFFNRAADTGGFNGWMTELNAGTSRSDVLDGFLGSQEFINLTNSYGILAFTAAPVPVDTNTPPTANAGTDQSAFLGESVTLDGSASSDSDGSISCYWWKDTTSLLSSSQTYTTSSLPLGTHTMTLTVIDNEGVSHSDGVSVIVGVDTQAPMFISENTAIEDEGDTTALTLNATDNLSSVTYSISGTDVAFFSVDVDTGEVSFNTVASYATQDTYTFIATATDENGNSVDQIVTVNLREVKIVALNSKATGNELWRTNGETSGTYLIKDINTKKVQYRTMGSEDPVVLNGAFYFVAKDETYGEELWKSDGTQVGTMLVKDIYPGRYSSDISELIVVNGALYFQADDGLHGLELWKSDGTKAGTVLLKDIFVGEDESDPGHLTNINGVLYFEADNDIDGTELWKSDGTEVGTVMVKNIRSGSSSSYPSGFALVNNMLYFRASDGSNGQELWKSNGTDAGTVMIKDINPTGDAYPISIYEYNGKAYFRADDGTNGSELWVSNGTTAGTTMLKDINPSGNGSPQNYIEMNGILYFTANDGVNGTELWRTDGTSANTFMLTDVRSGSASGIANTHFIIFNDELYFTADDGVNGYELWKADGTNAGTMIVKDIVSGIGASSPTQLTISNNILYFKAKNTTDGYEIWKTDGSDAGTQMVKDINTGGHSFPKLLINFNNALYFAAIADNASDYSLWKSGGTEASTVMYREGSSSTQSAVLADNGNNMVKIGDVYYFTADDGTHGNELWKSDGTEAGTVMIKDIKSGMSGSRPKYLENMNGTLYFQANEGINGIELWKSNGTPTGTVLVKQINLAVYSSSSPGDLTAVGSTLYFSAESNSSIGRELWKSDGTPAGTVLVKDIRAGSGDGLNFDNHFVGFNNKLYFSAYDGSSGLELWESNGTESGTVRTKDIRSGSASSRPKYLTSFNGAFYFSANSQELWKSDGTEVGTELVHDIAQGTDIKDLTVAGDILYFTLYDSLYNRELWKSDGSDAGTQKAVAFYDGTKRSLLNIVGSVTKQLLFIANDENGFKLLKTDGTDAGTVEIMDEMNN